MRTEENDDASNRDGSDFVKGVIIAILISIPLWWGDSCSFGFKLIVWIGYN